MRKLLTRCEDVLVDWWTGHLVYWLAARWHKDSVNQLHSRLETLGSLSRIFVAARRALTQSVTLFRMRRSTKHVSCSTSSQGNSSGSGGGNRRFGSNTVDPLFT